MIEYTVQVYANGDKSWYLNGERHREDGLPAIECADGYKAWYLNGKHHREDGPAIEYASGDRSWYLNDKLHREDGPAVIYANGGIEWWLNGEQLTEEEFNNRTNPKNAKLIKCLKQLLECLEGKS